MFIVTSLDGFVRAGTLQEPEKLQLYLALARSTTPIPAKGCAGTLKVAILLRVQSLDHTNPRRGLRGAPKSRNFTSRSVAGPMVRVARDADTSRSVAGPMVRVVRDAEKLEKVATLPRVRSRDYANPW